MNFIRKKSLCVWFQSPTLQVPIENGNSPQQWVKLKLYFQKAAVTPAINTIPKTGGIPDSKNC